MISDFDVIMMLAKLTGLMALALALAWVLRKRSAALRHVAVSTMVVAALVLPLLTLTLPPWQLPGCITYVPWQPASLTSTAAAPVVDDALPDSSASPHAPAGLSKTATVESIAPSTSGSAGRHFNWRTAALSAWAVGRCTLAFVWAIGALLSLAHLSIGTGTLGRVRRRASTVSADILEVAENACRTILGKGVVQRHIQILRSNEVSTPMTWGLVRPVVLLPAESDAWSTETIRASLLHEVAHVKRIDWLILSAARLLRAIYWFHPLMWTAVSILSADAERACDDLVVSAGMRPVDYAERLVEVVRSMPTSSPTVAMAMGRPTEVERRVKDVLDKGRDRRGMSRVGVLLTLVAIACLVVPVAILRPAAQASSTSTPRPSAGILWIMYIPGVQNVNHPNGYIRLDAHTEAGGKQYYTLTDLRTNTQLVDDLTTRNTFFQDILSGSPYTPKPGTTRYYAPKEFMSGGVNTIYLKPEQLKEARQLETQMKAWDAAMSKATMIVTDADVETNASAKKEPNGQAAVAINLTPSAGQRMTKFTSSHIGDTMEIFVNGSLLSAPTIQDAIGASGELDLGWSMAEANDFAKELNVLPELMDLKAKQKSALTNLKLLGLAVALYAEDHDEYFPPTNTMTNFRRAIEPYVQKATSDKRYGPHSSPVGDPFTSPLTGKEYTLTKSLSRINLARINYPAQTVILQDAPFVDPLGRRFQMRLYADSHAKMVNPN